VVKFQRLLRLPHCGLALSWQFNAGMSNKTPSLVSIQPAADYEPGRVLAALRACLEPLGGMKAFVQPGQRVLLKPNLLGPFAVERGVTTHPAVVRAAILLVREAGGRAFVGDSPGMGPLPAVARACGLEPVLTETGAELLDFAEPHEFDVPAYKVSPRLKLAKALSQVDVVVTLPKLKTHAQMTLTAALKNQYGCIPGALKSQWHFRLQQPEWLASLILDVNRVVRPALAILDAVAAMEGPGPSSGQLRHVGVLLASRDLAAADTLACHLIGLDPMRVPLLTAAREQDFGETRLERIRVVGDWQSLRVPDFKLVEQPVDLLRVVPLPKPALNWLRRQWTLRPQIIDGRCTRCGICEKGCPVAPAAIHPRAPAAERLDGVRCIRCYCCHEFCPSHAIELRAPWLARHLPLETLADRAGRLASFLSSSRRRRS
jgi:uncharacterized protein (DUF362 family)/Pyruvate/2-oxoacid:ferredoxin oxidoreductase delta subunit